MSYEDQIRYYSSRHDLTDGDAEFMIGLLRDALAKQRHKHAEIAWKMQMEDFGGGTAIGNAIEGFDT